MSSVWSKSRKAAERAFPTAIVALDIQCADLHGYTETMYRVEKRKGKPHRLCMNVNGYRRATGDRCRLRLRWHDAAEVWVRYSCAFRSKADDMSDALGVLSPDDIRRSRFGGSISLGYGADD